MNTTPADARIMRPTLILAGLAWISSAIGISGFFFLLITYGMNIFEPSLAFLPLAIGFSVFVAIQLSKRYKQGVPFNDDLLKFSMRNKAEQTSPANHRPFGTSGTAPASSASRAGAVPEASGDS